MLCVCPLWLYPTTSCNPTSVVACAYSYLLFILIYYLFLSITYYPTMSCTPTAVVACVYSYLLFILIYYYSCLLFVIQPRLVPRLALRLLPVFIIIFFFLNYARASCYANRPWVGASCQKERARARYGISFRSPSPAPSLTLPPSLSLSLGLSRSLARSDARTPSMIIKRVR